MNRYFLTILILICLFAIIKAKKFKSDEKPEWAKKNIQDYSDADLERLLDQWEEDEEPLEDDELPEHLRPQPKIDLSNINTQNPEDLLKLSKKGKTLMTFVNVLGNPTREEADVKTKLWQTSLWNNHIQAERYMVDDNRAIFLFKDGAQAWEAKDFLIEQEDVESVTIESKIFKGNYAPKDGKDEL